MKFFLNIILISSCLFPNWAYPCDVRDILEPSHRLSCQYSMRHNPQPKSVRPNISCSTRETPFEEVVKNVLSISSPEHLRSKKEGIPNAYARGLCLQLPLEYEHFPNYIPVSTNHDTYAGHLLSKHRNGILSPIRYDNLYWLWNVSSFGSSTSNKTKAFIETKVAAMELQGFNL